ncbi:MAG: ScpA family protein [Planctomycetota bacterium]
MPLHVLGGVSGLFVPHFGVETSGIAVTRFQSGQRFSVASSRAGSYTAEMVFRVELPVYNGPLDLLLYLTRRQEVSLSELSLSKLVEQYAEYLELLKELDLTDIGDFLDLASTLVELKSQAVLPKPVEEVEEDEQLEDPQAELVERLLQYKEIRDAASILDEMSSRWQQRYTRLSDDLPQRRIDPGDQPLADLEIWDLVSAFGRIMRESAGPPQTEVIYDDTPIHVYMQRIHQKLADSGRLPLTDLLDTGVHKSAVIGWFLATLELSRHHGAAVEETEHGDIVIVKTEDYRESLDVAEVDSYSNDALTSTNLPKQPR